jgi:Domain of unknown function (DUF4399)
MRSLHLLTLTAATLLLGACGHMHRHGYGADSRMAHTVAPTAPMSVTASVPVLSGGYTKVAASAGAAVYFIHLKNGDTVTSPVTVQFGLKGMGVAPAGVEKAGTGHHHLLVDLAALDANAPLPADDNHRHFGAGQTETLLALKPGVHTLQLLLGDQNHIPHHPPVMSERITITVK